MKRGFMALLDSSGSLPIVPNESWTVSLEDNGWISAIRETDRDSFFHLRLIEEGRFLLIGEEVIMSELWDLCNNPENQAQKCSGSCELNATISGFNYPGAIEEEWPE